jgi:hypothetical protein
MILEDGNEAQHPQAEIYAPSGISPVATLDLPHMAKGRYEGSWTPTSVGPFSALFITYSDVGHTIENIVYVRGVEQIFVSQSDVDDLAAAIVRLLGLNHENAFIDNTEFDEFGQLISARIRIFDSKTNAEAAQDGDVPPVGTTGLIATYTMEADYESEITGTGTIVKIKSYRYVLNP